MFFQRIVTIYWQRLCFTAATTNFILYVMIHFREISLVRTWTSNWLWYTELVRCLTLGALLPPNNNEDKSEARAHKRPAMANIIFLFHFFLWSSSLSSLSSSFTLFSMIVCSPLSRCVRAILQIWVSSGVSLLCLRVVCVYNVARRDSAMCTMYALTQFKTTND